MIYNEWWILKLQSHWNQIVDKIIKSKEFMFYSIHLISQLETRN